MPWKLVGFIICLILGTCFAGFNLENKCDISFGFTSFQNVPIFFSLIIAFSLGVLVTLPFTVIKKKSAKDKKAQAEQRAMKKIKKEQAKEARALAIAEKAAKKEAQEAAKAEKAAEKQQKAEEKKNKQFQKEGGVVSAFSATSTANTSSSDSTSSHSTSSI